LLYGGNTLCNPMPSASAAPRVVFGDSELTNTDMPCADKEHLSQIGSPRTIFQPAPLMPLTESWIWKIGFARPTAFPPITYHSGRHVASFGEPMMPIIIPPERDITDPEGHPLIPARGYDVFRRKPVWAVYKIQGDHHSVESRSSDFVGLDTAKATADDLNRTRPGETHYFKVYRLSDPLLPPNPGRCSDDK
jgi:hypothetical protein